MIHCRSVVDALRTRASVGSAVLRIVLSMTTMSRDRHITARTARRRGCPACSAPSGAPLAGAPLAGAPWARAPWA